MKYKIEWMEKKGAGWIIATLSEGNVQITDVSINKLDKKTNQVVFVNFDTLMPGSDIEGELWRNPAGKAYLFAPKPQAPVRTGGAGIKAAVEAKARSIEHSQDRKDNSIQLSSTFRDATLLTVASINQLDEPMNPDEIKKAWLNWRKWLMEQFGDAGDITETKKPF